MKTITDRATIARREKRKKLLLWQAEQLKRFKPFILVRPKEVQNASVESS